MGDQPGTSRKLDVLARRVDLLERLCDGPAYKRDLVEELDHSRSTINRAVSELEDVNLVERGDDGFEATVAGRLALERYGEFQREIDDVVDAEPVLGPVPADSPIDVEAVAGSDATMSTEPAPYRPIERFHDRIADARRYRALLPALDDPRHVRLLYEHVLTNDRSAELVVSPELFDALRTEFPRRTAAMADSGEFRVLVGEVPPFAVGLVDVGRADARAGPGADRARLEDDHAGPGDDHAGSVTVVVFNERGGVHGVIENATADAVRWAEDLYATARADAVDRTDALRPDADGGIRAVDGEGGTGLSPTGDTLSVPLEREGFVGLDTSYFRDEPVADPTTAWRSGLTLPEVHTGYAVERTTRTDDGHDWRTVEDEDGELAAALLSALTDGRNCVVVGPPGSGKSTTCKQVACRWYETGRGPVLYRESDRGRPFEAVDDLRLTVDASDGHALVVVEDAVRPDADGVFDAIEQLGDREDVSFLLDARETEWRDPPGDPTDVSDLDVITMPPLADRDCERLVEHFERTVGEPVDVQIDRLREEVRDEATAAADAAPSEVLLLLHRLATYADPLADGRTSLEEAVAGVYEDIAGDDLALDVCVLANALNAAGIAVDAGALYAVADPGEYAAVDDALDRLEGRVLFPREDGTYRTVHESWSATFLAHLLEAEGEAAAAARFGDCVTGLLSLADAPDEREEIARHRGGRWTLAAVVDDSAGWADETVEAVYALGRERPKLAPLFGDGEHDSVELPAACSQGIAAERPVWLGRMFVAGGYYGRAERAFERLPLEDADSAVERLLGLARVASERGEYDDAVADAEECLALVEGTDRPVVRARAQMELGWALMHSGEYEAARSHLQSALDGFEAVDDHRRMARTLDRLGLIAKREGESAPAREHFQRSLALSRDLGDRNGEANSLHNLGLATEMQGEYEAAREYHERSLELERDQGDRNGIAISLNTIGVVARKQGQYDRAREYSERSLEISRELGALQWEAASLINLGVTADRRGAYDSAREYLELSLDIARDIGDRQRVANSLHNLGIVAYHRGEYDRAREYQEQSLAVKRELGDRRGEARSLNNLGEVARIQGEYDRARECHERGLEISRELGDRHNEAGNLNNLGMVAHGQGEYDRAREYFEQAMDAVEDGGKPWEAKRVRLARGRLALARGDLDMAREWAEAARETCPTMDTTALEGRSRRLLGRVAAEAGALDTAREHWRVALETFETVGTPEDALATLEHLVETCREAGDDDNAEQWCERAEELIVGGPDPVAEEHREWVRRHRSELSDD